MLREARSGRVVPLGNGEIRITGEDGVRCAAPTLVYHYVAKHRYAPPAAFVDAVLRGTFERPSAPPPGSIVMLVPGVPIDSALGRELRRFVLREVMPDLDPDSARGAKAVTALEFLQCDGECDEKRVKVFQFVVGPIVTGHRVWNETREHAETLIGEQLANPAGRALVTGQLRRALDS